MTTWTTQDGGYWPIDDDASELERFEKFSYRRQGDLPCRAHSSRIRGRMRSRGGAAARQKARSYNGPNRRGTLPPTGSLLLSARRVRLPVTPAAGCPHRARSAPPHRSNH